MIRGAIGMGLVMFLAGLSILISGATCIFLVNLATHA